MSRRLLASHAGRGSSPVAPVVPHGIRRRYRSWSVPAPEIEPMAVCFQVIGRGDVGVVIAMASRPRASQAPIPMKYTSPFRAVPHDNQRLSLS